MRMMRMMRMMKMRMKMEGDRQLSSSLFSGLLPFGLPISVLRQPTQRSVCFCHLTTAPDSGKRTATEPVL